MPPPRPRPEGDDAPGGLPQVAGPVEDGVALGVGVGVDPPGRRRGLARAGLVVAPATAAANVLSYGFNAVVARGLGPDGYGALGALLGLVLIASVPALALQAVVARRVAAVPDADVAAVVRGLLRASAVVAVLSAGVAAALSPLVTLYLRLPSVSAALWMAASLLPFVVLSALQGVLQGRERFAPLSAVFVVAAGLRLAGGAVAVLAGGDAAAVLAGTTAGWALAALFAYDQVRRTTGAATPDGRPSGFARELTRAATGMFGLIVLANLDVLLARRHLPPAEAGLYAAGAVFAKVAFWAPQAVVILVFPRLSGARGAAVLRAALLAVTGSGVVLVAGTALLARPVVTAVFGPEYSELAEAAWLFTALGASLAVAQLLIFSGIAAQSAALGALVLATATAEAVLISTVLGDSLLEVVTTALGAALVLVAIGLLLTRRRQLADAEN